LAIFPRHDSHRRLLRRWLATVAAVLRRRLPLAKWWESLTCCCEQQNTRRRLNDSKCKHRKDWSENWLQPSNLSTVDHRLAQTPDVQKVEQDSHWRLRLAQNWATWHLTCWHISVGLGSNKASRMTSFIITVIITFILVIIIMQQTTATQCYQ